MRIPVWSFVLLLTVHNLVQTNASAQERHLLVVSSRVGTVIDSVERRTYNLFPLMQNFYSLSFYQAPDSNFSFVRFRRGHSLQSLTWGFDTFTFTDSLLTGSGALKRDNKTTPFNGSVPFHKVAFIERAETSYWKPVWVLPAVVGVTALSYAALMQHSSFHHWLP